MVTLKTSLENFDFLYTKVHGRGKNVTIPREMLFELLQDHSAMYDELEIDGRHIGKQRVIQPEIEEYTKKKTKPKNQKKIKLKRG